MAKLPKEIKLTQHARMRLEERKDENVKYDTRNLMRSSCKWWGKDDLIKNSELYLHCLYVTRKSKQMGYITDGRIEVVYNRGTGVAITILEVKDKFLPVTQYIKPDILGQIQRKKEIRKMRRQAIGECVDCGQTDVEISIHGLCKKCNMRKANAKARGKIYIPYKDLTEEEKMKVDTMRQAQKEIQEKREEIEMPDLSDKPVIENYYQVKAEKDPSIAHIVMPTESEKEEKKEEPKKVNPLEDQENFVNILRNSGCEIPEGTLKEILDVLLATDKLKDIFMVIAKDENQQAILDLDQALNVIERKLQHDWEYNGFQEADDIKFKSFLTWRRVLKGAIFFWKKLYQTGILIELKRAWTAYTSDPTDKPVLSSDSDRITSKLKRYQITTETISTILNTRRPFTRIFYATSEEEAHDAFIKWLSERQLHENKSKTTVVELSTEGEDGRQQD